jgi:hypothetical protein
MNNPDKDFSPTSYLEQTEAVKQRFERIKKREIILEVKGLDKVYKTAKGETLLDVENQRCLAFLQDWKAIVAARLC